MSDLLELEKEGVDVEPMHTLFRQNRVISSIAAELDQKSCWEILTDPQFTQKYFSSDERQVFRRHILWTRILSDRRTLLAGRADRRLARLRPPGARVAGAEAEPLLRRRRRGDWAVAGRARSGRRPWTGALADQERWVVQQLASIPVSEFPVLTPDGTVHMEPFYMVMGFAPSKYGLAVLGPSVAEAGRQRRPARRHVRGDGRPAARPARRAGLCSECPTGRYRWIK